MAIKARQPVGAAIDDRERTERTIEEQFLSLPLPPLPYRPITAARFKVRPQRC
ncbi:MAG: hypothetical protein ABSE54_06570 [Smithella sp.]